MSYPNSYSSCSAIFVDPWQENHQTYLDTTLSDPQSMLDDSAETVVFPSNDSSPHQQEPDSTTTNHPLLLQYSVPKTTGITLFLRNSLCTLV